MQILIKKNFKAVVQTEEFEVVANEKKGQFVLDTENETQFPFATLQEIAEANNFKLKKASKKDVMLKIETHFKSVLENNLEKITLREQKAMEQTNSINEIIKAGIEAGLDDDDMLIQIVQSGVKFKAAGKLFKAAMEEGGHRISAAKRNEEIVAILEEAEFAPEEYQEVQDMIDKVVSKVSDTTTVQAIKAIKKYLKELEIPYPKAPRKPKGGLRSRFMLLVLANPVLTLAELEDWLVENTKEEKVEGFLKKFTPLLHFAQGLAIAVVENEIDVSGIVLPEPEVEEKEGGDEEEAA